MKLTAIASRSPYKLSLGATLALVAVAFVSGTLIPNNLVHAAGRIALLIAFCVSVILACRTSYLVKYVSGRRMVLAWLVAGVWIFFVASALISDPSPQLARFPADLYAELLLLSFVQLFFYSALVVLLHLTLASVLIRYSDKVDHLRHAISRAYARGRPGSRARGSE